MRTKTAYSQLGFNGKNDSFKKYALLKDYESLVVYFNNRVQFIVLESSTCYTVQFLSNLSWWQYRIARRRVLHWATQLSNLRWFASVMRSESPKENNCLLFFARYDTLCNISGNLSRNAVHIITRPSRSAYRAPWDVGQFLPPVLFFMPWLPRFTDLYLPSGWWK